MRTELLSPVSSMQGTMMRNALAVLLALAVTSPSTNAVVYLFTEPEYSIAEDGTVNMDVKLQRTLSEGDSDGSITVPLSTECPTECPLIPGADAANQGTNGDYTFTNPTFAAGVFQADVQITIRNDDVEEFREYFCLSVPNTNERGSQWYTKIVIPWNDYCVELVTPKDGGTDDSSAGYTAAGATYVGPWSTDNPVTISVTLEPNAGGDINIFATDVADFAALQFYGIHLEDSEAGDSTHGTRTADYSFISDSDLKTLLDSEITTSADDYVEQDTENTYELTYDGDTISIDPTSNSEATLSATDSTDPLAIGHLFVSSAKDIYATWKVCGLGLDPRRLPVASAFASGQTSTFGPDKAVDGNNNPDISAGSCFVSDGDASGHWLQIDLGREFQVKKVIIFPVTSVNDVAERGWLNSARVYVGSCRQGDISNNEACNSNIGTVDGEDIIEVTCSENDNFYGRYVYILPGATSSDALALCEVQVYGSEVPIDDETKVEFSVTEGEVPVTEGDGTVQLTLTRTGAGSTCTYVDYYTDVSTNDADFTDVPASAPIEQQFIGSNVNSQPITITITDDGDCEAPETFNVYLENIEGGRLGTQCWNTVKITDDDSVTYSIPSNLVSNTIGEGDGPLDIPVERRGTGVMQTGSATLTFTDGTAKSSDYASTSYPVSFSSVNNSPQTETASINIVDDDCYEESETFTVNIGSLTPAACSATDPASEVQLTITDNDSQFQWDVNSDTITITEGDGPTQIDIERDGTVQDKTVEFSADHISTKSDDFSISPSSNSLEFSVGDGTESVTVTVQDDYEVEGDESFTLTLDPPGSSCPNGNRGDRYRLNIQIKDNDAEYFWKQDEYSVDEGGGQVTVCLEREGDISTAKTVQITSSGGNAQSGGDYTALTQISFAPDQAEKCAAVQIRGDTNIEDTETFTLTISEGQNIAIGSPNVATVTIKDDDATISWEQPSYSFTEGNVGSVVITKSGNIEVSGSITPTSSSAINGVDFSLGSTSFTIPASSSSIPITINFIDDDEYEANQVLTLTLSLDSGSTAAISQALTTIAIADNDPPPTEPPADGLGSGAIAAISVAAVIGVLTIIGAIGFIAYMFGGVGSAGAAGAASAGGASAANAYGAQLTNLGYPSSGGYETPNYGFGNGFGSSNGYGIGGNPYGF